MEDSSTQTDHLDQLCLLTAERDRAVISLNEQMELTKVQNSKSEAADARCSGLAAANHQEKNSCDLQISQLRNEIDVLVSKNKEIANAHNQSNQDLQDERSHAADLTETIRHLKNKIAQLEVKLTTDKKVHMKESGGDSNHDNQSDYNDDCYEERTVGTLLDSSHHDNTHSHDHDHDHDLDNPYSEGNSRKRRRYLSPGLHDTHGEESTLSNFNMHTTPPPSPLSMGPLIDSPMQSFSPAPISNTRSPKIAPIPRPQIDPLNSEWHIPPSWVPENAHISVIDGKWRAGSDKEDALRNEALCLPPPGLGPPFGTGFPQNIDQVKEYMELARQPNQELALAYVLSWVKATEKIHPSQYLSWMSYL
ncbi:hypothetical protein BDN71DRAFT_1513933 [Pleurotus eryngii]|uniref:Uncharacterized protein n=1 Tax=Pleurotus eryngii TaxID=5323 RepID=A0A9P6D9B0_PLEER|nr:hypothetical protein BDN71DRAFT_1513933 [Pleurotus eryngii]